jgi:hypothetical protein
VQSVLKDEVLHYRLDTEDALQPVDDSFLVGGETVVIERRHADATWTLPSAKGPRMWKNLEVGDYVDAKLRMNAWTAAVVEEVAGAKALVAAIDKNGKSIGESAWLVAEDAIAPFRSRSRAQAATPATASFVSKLRHLRVTSASHAVRPPARVCCCRTCACAPHCVCGTCTTSCDARAGRICSGISTCREPLRSQKRRPCRRRRAGSAGASL